MRASARSWSFVARQRTEEGPAASLRGGGVLRVCLQCVRAASPPEALQPLLGSNTHHPPSTPFITTPTILSRNSWRDSGWPPVDERRLTRVMKSWPYFRASHPRSERNPWLAEAAFSLRPGRIATFHGEGYQEGYAEGTDAGVIEGRQYGVQQDGLIPWFCSDMAEVALQMLRWKTE
ncbi:protein LTO1 homolog isoform X2 [Hemicordylus capensis]|uniref:protein LTO1 homolog isoform X2 n=1 Tax=Hemicordylus capensis TaxID=884348 RepID=UPI002302B155|nr:protein LTO1 homolog isoform X2 [Hemicordylus capensis]